jgi:hypothetical protein
LWLHFSEVARQSQEASIPPSSHSLASFSRGETRHPGLNSIRESACRRCEQLELSLSDSFVTFVSFVVQNTGSPKKAGGTTKFTKDTKGDKASPLARDEDVNF